MPFEDAFFEIYEMLSREFSDDFEFSHAGEEGNQQNILKDIIQPIYDADVIIADLTGLNPNVLYELGVAHTFNKKTIVITQDDLSSLPFDLKQYRTKGYSTHFKEFKELTEDIRRNLYGAISGDVYFRNPVKDFITTSGIHNTPWFDNEKIIVEIEHSEKGFLDFIADIEEDTEQLTECITEIVNDMQIMTEGIERSTSNIEKVGGTGSASFARKEAKKVAGYMNAFSAELKSHNTNYATLWNRIEKNILGLLEFKISAKEEDKTDIIEYMRSLKLFQLTILSSRKSIAGMKEASFKNLGFERTLNQAIRFLDQDLQTQLDAMDFSLTSIDKIISKSKFVVGEIDFSGIEGKQNAAADKVKNNEEGG
jgi:hypothetical protein